MLGPVPLYSQEGWPGPEAIVWIGQPKLQRCIRELRWAKKTTPNGHISGFLG